MDGIFEVTFGAGMHVHCFLGLGEPGMHTPLDWGLSGFGGNAPDSGSGDNSCNTSAPIENTKNINEQYGR